MKKERADHRHDAIWPWLGGAVLGGTIMLVLACLLSPGKLVTAPTVGERMVGSGSTATSALAQASSVYSFFQQHNVGQGGRYVHIFQDFCFSDAECGGSGLFREFDLMRVPLPVERIQTAVTDGNRVIAYAASPEVATDSLCQVPDLYVFELANGVTSEKTIKLKNDARMWTCDGRTSALTSITNGARYLRIDWTGGTGEGMSWFYDVQKDAVDQELTDAYRLMPYTPSVLTTFSAEESNEDRFSIYLSGCSAAERDEDMALCSSKLALYLRNNVTGEKVRLTAVEAAWKAEGYMLAGIESIRYEDWTNKGTLTVSGDGLGRSIVFSNLQRFFPKSWR